MTHKNNNTYCKKWRALNREEFNAYQRRKQREYRAAAIRRRKYQDGKEVSDAECK